MSKRCENDQHFVNEIFANKKMNDSEFDCCTFKNCDFSNADLSRSVFLDCVFEECIVSLVKVTQTTFNETVFRHCKMLGIHWETCNRSAFLVKFEHCILDHSTFNLLKFNKVVFQNLSLRDVDFTGCDLTESVFKNCDLSGALFENSLLEKTDFRLAENFTIDPEKNQVQKAKFQLQSLPGLLTKYDLDIS